MKFLHSTSAPRAFATGAFAPRSLAPLAVLASCAGALLFAGCGNKDAENTDAGTTPATAGGKKAADAGAGAGNTAGAGGKKLKLAFVCNNASDYWTIARKGTEQATKELPNVTVDFKLPAAGTAAEQTQLVDDLLSSGEDGLAISPVDAANQGDALNRAAKQTLVFTQDSDAPTSNRVCYIGTDNRQAGREAGKLVKKALPNGGKIMAFVGKIDAQNAKDRFDGLKEELKGSKVQILDVRTDNTDRAKAKSNVTDALVTHPDLAACVGLWSYNAPAILSAVKDAKAVGKVKIIAFDEEDDTLDGVASGAIAGTIVQQPYRFGYLAIINMSKYLNGDKTVVPASKQIFVPTRTIDKSNVEAFRAELKKLRGK